MASYNTAIGTGAGAGLTTGGSNVAVGYQAMSAVTAATVSDSVAVGISALAASSGTQNTAVGGNAMYMLTSGAYNVAVGRSSGNALRTGSYNTSIGTGAGGTSAGTNQIAIGAGATATADNQVVIGGDGSAGYLPAITEVVPGKNKSAALGSTTNAWTGLYLAGSTSGYIGLQAPATPSGYTLTLPATAGTLNQVLTTNGSGVLSWAAPATATTATNLAGGVAGAVPYQSATGASGFSAAGTSGQVLVSGGTGAPTWTNNITGSAANVTGTVGVANGGTGLTALGTANQVLTVNAGATAAAWVNPAAASVGSDGSSNTKGGGSALASGTPGSRNTAFGFQALKVATGQGNTAVGADAGAAITSGSENTLIGNYAENSSAITGTKNTGIGSSVSFGDSAAINRTAIGYAAAATADNQVMLGNASVTQVTSGGYGPVATLGTKYRGLWKGVYTITPTLSATADKTMSSAWEANALVLMNSASALKYTIDALTDGYVYPVGYTFQVAQLGLGVVTVWAAPGVVITSKAGAITGAVTTGTRAFKTTGIGAVVTLVKIGTDTVAGTTTAGEWLAYGDLTTAP